ncbi:PREDICTED: regulator of G-protein signaling 8 isoform X2 [Myotis brandtii]|nr:PREDICTED: regulator of G-protein signaling 8 isoform X2 [Myotis brandtii]XP_014383849.1 PREDICTED: regulator of G-protein signaling 8 isoform X2 [Myotis brandtii]
MAALLMPRRNKGMRTRLGCLSHKSDSCSDFTAILPDKPNRALKRLSTEEATRWADSFDVLLSHKCLSFPTCKAATGRVPSPECSQGPGSLGIGNQQAPSDLTWSGTASGGLFLGQMLGQGLKVWKLVGGPPVPTLPCRLPPTQLSSPASSCSHTKPRFSLCSGAERREARCRTACLGDSHLVSVLCGASRFPTEPIFLGALPRPSPPLHPHTLLSLLARGSQMVTQRRGRGLHGGQVPNLQELQRPPVAPTSRLCTCVCVCVCVCRPHVSARVCVMVICWGWCSCGPQVSVLACGIT